MSFVWTEPGANSGGILGSNLESAVNYVEAHDALTEELSRHRSILGRLAAIASFWDDQAGRYSHKLAARYGTEETDRALRRLHQEIFVNWLSLPLRQKQADLAVYLGGLGSAQWFGFQGMGKRWVPRTATLPERDLFLLDLDLIRALHRY